MASPPAGAPTATPIKAKPTRPTAHSPPSPPATNIPAPCARTGRRYAGATTRMARPTPHPAATRPSPPDMGILARSTTPTVRQYAGVATNTGRLRSHPAHSPPSRPAASIAAACARMALPNVGAMTIMGNPAYRTASMLPLVPANCILAPSGTTVELLAGDLMPVTRRRPAWMGSLSESALASGIPAPSRQPAQQVVGVSGMIAPTTSYPTLALAMSMPAGWLRTVGLAAMATTAMGKASR